MQQCLRDFCLEILRPEKFHKALLQNENLQIILNFAFITILWAFHFQSSFSLISEPFLFAQQPKSNHLLHAGRACDPQNKSAENRYLFVNFEIFSYETLSHSNYRKYPRVFHSAWHQRQVTC